MGSGARTAPRRSAPPGLASAAAAAPPARFPVSTGAAVSGGGMWGRLLACFGGCVLFMYSFLYFILHPPHPPHPHPLPLLFCIFPVGLAGRGRVPGLGAGSGADWGRGVAFRFI